MGKKDVFPRTEGPWIHEKLRQKDTAARRDLNHHVMEVYFEPLQVYFRGSSFRWLGEAPDLVSAFFGSRLGRNSFYRGWQRARIRFRYWLMSSFKQFLQEQRRVKERDDRMGRLPEDLAGIPPTTEQEIDREFAKSIVNHALRMSVEKCREKDLTDHWSVLVDRFVHGQSYAKIGARLGVTDVKARGMARTAREIFRRALRCLLREDGVPPKEIDREIRSLMEALAHVPSR